MTATRGARLRAEILPFLEKFFLLEDGKAVRLESWQKEKVFEPVFSDLDERGLRRVNLAVIGVPKKNGKSTMAAMVATYGLLADGEPEPEIYGVAGDRDQAAKNLFHLFRDRRIRLFQHGELVKELLSVKIVEKVYGYRIDHPAGQHDDHVIALGLACLEAVHTSVAPRLQLYV